MEFRSQIGIGPNALLEGHRLSGESVPPAALDVYAGIVTSSFHAVDGASFVSSTIRQLSVWETLLVTIVFTLIAILVGVRAAHVLSERTADVTRPRSHDDTDRPPSNERAHDAVSPDDSRTDRPHPHPYEGVLSVDTPAEFLSDEGRVVQLLVENGGRIRQHRITDDTGWSKSKVSRILSRMCEDGTVEKITIGRENVIILPEERDDGADGSTRSADADNPVP